MFKTGNLLRNVRAISRTFCKMFSLLAVLKRTRYVKKSNT